MGNPLLSLEKRKYSLLAAAALM